MSDAGRRMGRHGLRDRRDRRGLAMANLGHQTPPRYGLRLTILVCLAAGGLIDLFIAGLHDEWPFFIVGIVVVAVVQFLLGTGLWMRWPRV